MGCREVIELPASHLVSEGMDAMTANAIFKTSATNLNVMRSPAHAVAAAVAAASNSAPSSVVKTYSQRYPGSSTSTPTLTPSSAALSGEEEPKGSGEKMIRLKFEEIYRATPVPMALQKDRTPSLSNGYKRYDETSSSSNSNGRVSSVDGVGRHRQISSPPNLNHDSKLQSPQFSRSVDDVEHQMNSASRDEHLTQRPVFKRGSRHSGGSLINLPLSVKTNLGGNSSSNSNHKNTSVVVDDDSICACCHDGDSYEGNTILFCDNCDLSVHQNCYGILTVPAGSWFCNVCQVNPAKKPETIRCEICSHTGGALKPTDQKDKWIHILCANWIPEIYCMDTKRKQPFVLAGLNKKRASLKCFVCKLKGICVQCSYGKCTVSAHPMCVYDRDVGFTKGFYCKQHRNDFDALPMYSGEKSDEEDSNSDSSISPLQKRRKVDRSKVNSKNAKATGKNGNKGGYSDEWSEEDKLLLYQAHASVPVTAVDFWKLVAKAMDNKKNSTECQKQWFQSLETGDRSRKERRERMKERKDSDLDKQVREADSTSQPIRKRIDRSCIQRIAAKESIAEKEDDIFDVLKQKNGRDKSSISSSASTVSNEAIERASSVQIEQSPGGVRATRSSVRINPKSSQHSWKASYAYKLAKRSDGSTSQVADSKKMDPKFGKHHNGIKKGGKKNFIEGNVSATISPSGRVRTAVKENSDNEIDEGFDEIDDDC